MPYRMLTHEYSFSEGTLAIKTVLGRICRNHHSNVARVLTNVFTDG